MPPPRRCGASWSDNSGEGNTTQSQRRGGSGGQALSPPLTGNLRFVEHSGSDKAEFPKHILNRLDIPALYPPSRN